MKKPFVRSPLDRLPLHVKQQIAAWLTTGGPDGAGFTYKQVAAKLLAEHGVKTGITSLSGFFNRHARPTSPAPIDATFNPATGVLTFAVNLRTVRNLSP